MIITENNIDDARTYYKGTWCKFRESGDELWHIDDITHEAITAINTKGEDGKVLLRDGYKLDFVIPKRTTYQYANMAAHLQRIPARMWKKGLHAKNTSFQVLLESGWAATEFKASIIEGFINKPCYYSLQHALYEFESNPEYHSVALSPRFAITRGGRIYLDTVRIGIYDGKEIIVKKILVPEMERLVRESEMTLTVKGIG